VIVTPCDESGAESAHNARDIGTCDFGLRDQLQCAQNCLIVERAALHNDMRTQLLAADQLDDLE